MCRESKRVVFLIRENRQGKKSATQEQIKCHALSTLHWFSRKQEGKKIRLVQLATAAKRYNHARKANEKENLNVVFSFSFSFGRWLSCRCWGWRR